MTQVKMFIHNRLTQHVSGIIMPIVRRTEKHQNCVVVLRAVLNGIGCYRKCYVQIVCSGSVRNVEFLWGFVYFVVNTLMAWSVFVIIIIILYVMLCAEMRIKDLFMCIQKFKFFYFYVRSSDST